MAMVRIMWTYELPADEVLLCLQLMIHKLGKGWSKRGDFRPITLCNDLYKCLDASWRVDTSLSAGRVWLHAACLLRVTHWVWRV